MSNEKDHIDPIEDLFKDRFDDDEIQAPESAWMAISSEIAAPASQALILKLKIGLAISTIAAITFGTLWLTEKNIEPKEIEIKPANIEENKVILPDTLSKTVKVNTPASTQSRESTVNSTPQIREIPKSPHTNKKPTIQKNSSDIVETDSPIQDTLIAVKNAIPIKTDTTTKTVEPTQKIQVQKELDPYQELLKKGKKSENKEIFIPE